MSKGFAHRGVWVSMCLSLACTAEPGDGGGDDQANDDSTTAAATSDGTGQGSTGDNVDPDSSDDSAGSTGDTVVDPPTAWEATLIQEVRSPAFLAVEDLNGDSRLEIILTTLMQEGDPSPFTPPPAGAVHVFSRTSDDLSTWDPQVVFGTERGLGFINEPHVFDADEDGQLDIVLNTGFLITAGGTHQYLPGPDFAEPVPFTAETEASDYFWHGMKDVDLDGDGDLDVVTTRTFYEGIFGMPPTWELASDWYRNDGAGTFTAFEIDTGHCGVQLTMYDVDGDGDSDMVCPQFFGPPAEPSIVWLEQVTRPAEDNGWVGEWAAHPIDSTTGLGFDTHFVDIDGDGQDELLYSNHNNQNNPDLEGLPSGIYAFEIPADPATSSAWEKIVIDEGYEVTAPDMGNPASQGSPGLISIGDIDDNGLVDVVTSGDGAEGLFVIWQITPGQFERRLIADGDSFGEAMVIDLDGDGQLEVLAAQHMHFVDQMLPVGNLSIYQPVFE